LSVEPPDIFRALMKTTDSDAMVIDEPQARETAAKPAGDTDARPTAAIKEARIYIDGKFYPQAEAKVSVFDHGLLYGDGIFEGIRFYNGRVFRLEEHLERLWDSARSMATRCCSPPESSAGK